MFFLIQIIVFVSRANNFKNLYTSKFLMTDTYYANCFRIYDLLLNNNIWQTSKIFFHYQKCNLTTSRGSFFCFCRLNKYVIYMYLLSFCIRVSSFWCHNITFSIKISIFIFYLIQCMYLLFPLVFAFFYNQCTCMWWIQFR